MRIILASASARRKELLERLVENFEIIKSEFDENSIEFQGEIGEYAVKLAKGKAYDVLQNINDESIIIASDTLVFLDGDVLGKPKDKQDAYKMLRNLSGKTHQVCTGVTLINSKTNKLMSDYVITNVKFSAITDEDITKYINSGEPFDKAGSYGIQGLGGVFVEKIDGCYYNVVGLPINRLKSMLIGMGVNL